MANSSQSLTPEARDLARLFGTGVHRARLRMALKLRRRALVFTNAILHSRTGAGSFKRVLGRNLATAIFRVELRADDDGEGILY